MADYDKYAMSRADEETLRMNTVTIIKRLDLSDPKCAGYLKQHRILTDHAFATLKSKPTPYEQAEYLLSLLPRRGPKAFKVFIYALMESEQDDLANTLSLKLANEYNREHPISQSIQESHNKGTTQCAPSCGSTDAEEKCNRSYHAQPSSNDAQDDSGPPSYQSLSVQQVPRVTHVEPGDLAIKNLLADKGIYKMARIPRGRALIVNMDRNRTGSQEDVLNVTNLFKDLHFEIVPAQNCTKKELKEKIGDEISDHYHKKADAFIMFVMAHGDIDNIICADGKPVNINKELIQPFHADVCPDLAGKPKVFFIQACQREKSRYGVGVASDSELTSGNEHTTMGTLSLDDSHSQTVSMGHPMDGIIIEYATVPGYQAFRDKTNGSWFVQSLVEVFTENAHKLHLCDMLKKVREKVKQKGVDNQMKQLTQTEDRSSKSLYFFPGFCSSE